VFKNPGMQRITQIFKELAETEFKGKPKEETNKSGKSLLIFVYFIGFWEKPNGSRVFTPRGERFNLDQHTLALASASQNTYVINWLEMGLEAEIDPTEVDSYQVNPLDQ